MITLNDIIIEPNEDEDYNFSHGYISKSVKLFGQIRFEEKNEGLGLSVDKSVNIDTVIDKLNAYLKWLGDDCQQMLEDYYAKENQDMLDEWYDGKLEEDWYETLEMYSGTIDILADGRFGATFSCGDNMNEDHLLEIEILDKQITEMWFDG
ncbi:MAG: hypothetical protein LBV43_12530 [Prevotella sp.]|jgi:hypothetical protein|nr:hypothetical protein [Prevotella sp.]